ncbi:hypothetical protein NSK_003739 [Nannochloropsis salina CCMP1776]|uniref:Uncharacterized protein n=1 Tax=Nannochloropsis salina CCMP1776 TaxID=1027361 RepID=A0A4D9D1Q2_9STRA|nr:hypothetical protein NSK_003739 [Nannochloropsis salina CCMP1776]|eukprot:TFJ85316.1 hypothetical protein NSK_003739 [Nannochloropsis salina CCMP1776]
MMQPPQQQQQAPPQHPPPPSGGPPGVQQLTGQFSQMGLRPPHQPPPPPTHPSSPYSQPSHAQQHPDLAGPPGGSGPVGYPGHYRPPSMDYTGAPPPQGMGPSPVPGMEAANQLPMLSEVDLSIASDPRFMRFTVSKIPNSQNNAAATKLPLGVVIQPMALDASGQDSIDVVNFGATGIVRCKKCRTYINPFVSWHDAGRRWRCNVCGTLNDVSSSYFNHLDQHGQRRDKHERPELSNGSVELVAPGEYMVRPPQPPVYLFVVDVSYSSVASGLLARTVETIKKNLDALPGDPRTQFGLVTFDSTVHFYHFKPSLKMPQVLVVPDISELFLPLPEDMLVNLKESREVIDLLLETLPGMYEKTRNMDSALGPALTGAYRVMAPVGGKMCVVLASMPTLGDGRLKPREELRALGTEREHAMLNPEESWYRTKAVEFSRVQISVDLFCVAPAGQQTPFMDLASLTALSKFTGGNLFYYPGFAVEKDGRKLEEEMGGILTRPTGFEAVMRVRATRGLKVTQFYGNYYIRGTDLLALPNCSSESVFGVEMAHDEAFLTASVICVQAALLHTTSSGERRIRVHTVAAPVTAVLQEVIASVDVDTLCNLMAKRMLEVALKTGLDAARHRLTQVCADLLRSCRAFSAHQPQGGASGYHQQQQQQPAGIPSTLELLPLYTMAMTKNVAFRGGTDIRPDLRTYMMQLFSVMNVATSRAFIHPNLFALHTMGNEAGLPVPPSKDSSTDEATLPPTAGRQKIRLPVAVNLSGERFVSEGIYLLENGVSLYLWVGARADPRQLAALFGGMTSVEGTDGGILAQLFEEGKEEGDYARRVHAIVQALREERSLRWLQVQVVKEGDAGLEASSLYRNLVEDRAAFSGGQYSYAEFMGMVSRGGGGGMPGGMGGGAQGVVGGMGGGPPPGMGYPPPSSVMR